MIEIERFDTFDATNEFLVDLKELLFTAFDREFNFSNDDWEHGLGGTHIVVRNSEILVSHAAVVPRKLHIGERVLMCGYVENVATAHGWRFHGFGAMAMRGANEVISSRYELGTLSTSSKDFYRKLGWKDWQGPSYVVMGSQWVRSKSEDAGIMVLETGAVPKLDLQARIACEERSGDSWRLAILTRHRTF